MPRECFIDLLIQQQTIKLENPYIFALFNEVVKPIKSKFLN